MTYAVLVIDMFHYGEDQDSLVDGFPTEEAAAEYARARTWDSVEALRMPNQTHDELRDRWLTFGEDALVLNGSYKGYDELEHFVDQIASPSQRDWAKLAPPVLKSDSAPA